MCTRCYKDIYNFDNETRSSSWKHCAYECANWKINFYYFCQLILFKNYDDIYNGKEPIGFLTK